MITIPRQLKLLIALLGIVSELWVSSVYAQNQGLYGSTILYEDELLLVEAWLARRQDFSRPESHSESRGYAPAIACSSHNPTGSNPRCSVFTYFSTLYCRPNSSNCALSTGRNFNLTDLRGWYNLSFTEIDPMLEALRTMPLPTTYPHFQMSSNDIPLGSSLRARCWTEGRCDGFVSCSPTSVKRGCTIFLDR